MGKILRILGWIDVCCGLILAIAIQSQKISNSEIQAAKSWGRPLSGLDPFLANSLSAGALVSAFVSAVVFFALARLLERVDEIAFMVGAHNKQPEAQAKSGVRGMVVRTIAKDGAAAQSQLRVSDVIVEYNGHPTMTNTELVSAINSSIGNTLNVKVVVYRDGGRLEFEIPTGRLGATVDAT